MPESHEIIKIAEFENYCEDLLDLIIDLFTWIEIPGSIHRALVHAVDRMRANGNRGKQ